MAQEKMRIHVEFFMDAVEDDQASKLAGRPIFKDQESVRIRWVGDNKREHVATAHSQSFRDKENNQWVTYAQRFPEIYEAFKRNAQYVGSGTPLDEAPFLTAAQRAELKAINIFTIEALSDPTSGAIAKMGMGGRTLVNKAVAFLENAAGHSPAVALAADNAAMKTQIAEMQRQMQALMAGQPVAPAPEPEPATDDESETLSVFDKWDDESLKAFIKEKSGQAPRGTPSHSTLVRMADEANAKVAA